MNELTSSKEKIPARDEREAVVKSLEAKCRRIVNLAHDVREASEEAYHLELELRVKIDEKDALDASVILNQYAEAQRRFGALEADLYNLKDEIEAELKVANRDRRFGIYVAHTAEGLPIRVSKVSKTPLWG